MKIQINSDKTVEANEAFTASFTAKISDKLERYGRHITRVEVHLSDENGKKEGQNDIRCLMEARLEGRQPIAVTSQDATEDQAISGAIDKLKASLDTVLGRLAEIDRTKPTQD